MLNNKYRVHEVAKDFGRNSKEISDILTQYASAPKNHMQPLDDRELSIIFDYLTQHNQVESMESIFADVYHEAQARGETGPERRAPERRAKGPEPSPRGSVPPRRTRDSRRRARSSSPPPQPNAAPKGRSGGQSAQQNPGGSNRPGSRVPEKKIVDTRKAGNVNLEKYDERLEQLAPEKEAERNEGRKAEVPGPQRQPAQGRQFRQQAQAGGAGPDAPPPA